MLYTLTLSIDKAYEMAIDLHYGLVKKLLLRTAHRVPVARCPSQSELDRYGKQPAIPFECNTPAYPDDPDGIEAIHSQAIIQKFDAQGHVILLP